MMMARLWFPDEKYTEDRKPIYNKFIESILVIYLLISLVPPTYRVQRTRFVRVPDDSETTQ